MLTLNKTPIGETGCLCIFFLFFNYLPHVTGTPLFHSSFSDLWGSPPALTSTPTLGFCECIGIQFFNLLTCVLQDVMSCQRSPTLTLREVENIRRGGNYYKHVPLPTYLAWLQPFYYDLWFIFIHVKTVKILLVVKTLIKNIEQQSNCPVVMKI